MAWSRFAARIGRVWGDAKSQLPRIPRWVRQWNWAALMLAAWGFGQGYEYGIELAGFYTSAVSACFALFNWTAVPQWPKFTRAVKLFSGISIPLVMVAVATVLVLGQKGAQPWSRFPGYYRSLYIRPRKRGAPAAAMSSAVVIQWNNPEPIIRGTPLSKKQLNATFSVDGNKVQGTAVYNPDFAAILPLGRQTLKVTFTPADVKKFATTSKTVFVLVKKKRRSQTVPSATPPTATLNHPAPTVVVALPQTVAPGPDSPKPQACPPSGSLAAGWELVGDHQLKGIRYYISGAVPEALARADLGFGEGLGEATQKAETLWGEIQGVISLPKSPETVYGPLSVQGEEIRVSFNFGASALHVFYRTLWKNGQTLSRLTEDVPIARLSQPSQKFIKELNARAKYTVDQRCLSDLYKMSQ